MVMGGASSGTEELWIDSPIGIHQYLSQNLRIPGISVLRNPTNGEAYMSVQITAVVGPQVLTDGQSMTPIRQDRFGALMVSELQGRYAENVTRGVVYSACNPASQATSAALATAYTGVCVTNPPASGRNLVILSAGFSSVAAPAGIINVGLMGGAGAVTHTAQLIIHSNYVSSAMTASSSGAVAIADSSATIPTPVLLMPLHDGHTSAALGTAGTQASTELSGLFVVAPGSFVAIYTFTAAAGEGFISWQEVPI